MDISNSFIVCCLHYNDYMPKTYIKLYKILNLFFMLTLYHVLSFEQLSKSDVSFQVWNNMIPVHNKIMS